MQHQGIALPDWQRRLLEVASRGSVEREQRFLQLVDMVNGQVTLPVAEVLMKTFVAEPDHGTQERVVSVLASANEQIQVAAILGEMPRLVVEAPEWAEALLCNLLEHNLGATRSFLASASARVRHAVRMVAVRDDFVKFQPAARHVHEYCK